MLADGLALGALPEEIERERRRVIVIGLVHHPLAAETGLDPATAATLEISERRALRSLAPWSSPAAGRHGSLTIASRLEPGPDSAPLSRRAASTMNHGLSAMSHQPSDVALLCVATAGRRAKATKKS